ncbi:MAG TPA: hypothetical protein VGO93_21220 [Candidatus Xenobia bacterium]
MSKDKLWLVGALAMVSCLAAPRLLARHWKSLFPGAFSISGVHVGDPEADLFRRWGTPLKTLLVTGHVWMSFASGRTAMLREGRVEVATGDILEYDGQILMRAGEDPERVRPILGEPTSVLGQSTEGSPYPAPWLKGDRFDMAWGLSSEKFSSMCLEYSEYGLTVTLGPQPATRDFALQTTSFTLGASTESSLSWTSRLP